MLQNPQVGQKVMFGRPNGEQTLGEIVKVNPARLKIKQLETRGSGRILPEGTIWNVPAYLCTPVNETGATPRPLPSLPVLPSRKTSLAQWGVGDRVEFTAKGKTYKGVVKSVNRKSVTVVPSNPDRIGQYWRVGPSLLRRQAA